MSSFYSAAIAIIENQDGEILMVQESKDFIEGTWDFPGGGWEDKESVIDCVEREVLEETGYTVNTEELVGLYKGASNRNGTETIVFVFTASIDKDIEQKDHLEDDILDARFFKPEELKSLDLREENRLEILENYLKGEKYPVEILWNQLSLLKHE